MTTPTSAELTDFVIAAAEAVGEIIGDGEAPVNADSLLSAGLPYATVFSTGAREVTGPMDDRNADVRQEYQITTVGVSRKQAEDVREQIRAAVLGYDYSTLTGREVSGEITVEIYPVDRDDAVQPPAFYAIDLFVFYTVPT